MSFKVKRKRNKYLSKKIKFLHLLAWMVRPKINNGVNTNLILMNCWTG